nr:MAG TPA: hypothetical protein [Caudoviricetes sp.]
MYIIISPPHSRLELYTLGNFFITSNLCYNHHKRRCLYC